MKEPIKLSSLAKQSLIDLEDTIKDLQFEIEKAKLAFIDIGNAEEQLTKLIKQRDGLLKYYV